MCAWRDATDSERRKKPATGRGARAFLFFLEGWLFVWLNLSEECRHLTRFGEPPLIFLGKNDLAVKNHVEYPAVAGDKIGVNVESLFEFCRQTDGLGIVISDGAVVNIDLPHGEMVLCLIRLNELGTSPC